jgi:hypothetical protein
MIRKAEKLTLPPWLSQSYPRERFRIDRGEFGRGRRSPIEKAATPIARYAWPERAASANPHELWSTLEFRARSATRSEV